MKPDAEHEQNDANFGKLGSEGLISDETRCEGPYGDTRKEIPHQWGYPDTLSNCAEDERKPETNDEDTNQGRVVIHRNSKS